MPKPSKPRLRRGATMSERKEWVRRYNKKVELLKEAPPRGAQRMFHVKCLTDGCPNRWLAQWSNIQVGKGCKLCASRKLGRKRQMPRREMVKRLGDLNPNLVLCDESPRAKGGHRRFLILCRVCDWEWEPEWSSLQQGHGCPSCGNIKKGKGRSLTWEQRVTIVAAMDPTIVLQKEQPTPLGQPTMILCVCTMCNRKWESSWGNLKAGKGCRPCKARKAGDALVYAWAKMVTICAKKNPGLELLEDLGKREGHRLLRVRCRRCGREYDTTWNSVQQGRECKPCSMAVRGLRKDDAGELYLFIFAKHGYYKFGINKRGSKRQRSHEMAGGKALYIIRGTLSTCYEIEQSIKTEFAQWKVRPNNNKMHGGISECLSLEAPVEILFAQLEGVALDPSGLSLP